MLGCQDFCGYYDWTFGHVRRRLGEQALREYWSEAIGGDSQSHYERAGRENGLTGLLRTWVHTGEEEHCDWTFTLDEERNTLRWDMRKCPSKGFLLQHDLNASEDYCDHCMGWIVPMLERVGAEIVGHEHNHCGQCWAEISMKGRPRQSLDIAADIRRDFDWKQGYLDRWRNGRKLPLFEQVCPSVDPCEVLEAWFSRADRIVVPDSRAPTGSTPDTSPTRAAVLLTDEMYVAHGSIWGDPAGVLIGQPPSAIKDVAKRFLDTPSARRPLLMHLYLPGCEPINFAEHSLPRPVPVLPLLIRRGNYTHRADVTCPTAWDFLLLLAESLGKPVSTPI